MNSFPHTHPRRTHRKRASALRLSSDTTSTLPEYIATGGWQRTELETPSDLPPDYPDSAEEADEDTDSDNHKSSSSFLPQTPQTTPLSPRRARRFASHRRRQPSSPSSDPYLDNLLARSVHALEMSNTLLQSSMSTQTTLSTVMSSDSIAESSLETSARGLSSRIRDNRELHETWADDLEEISRGVEGLFSNGDGDHRRRSSNHSHLSEGSISSSLPTSTPLADVYRSTRRRPSLDLRAASSSEVPHLRYEAKGRNQLISPPPRALTQYVASTSDADTIFLPSTLGLRSTSSSYHANSASTSNLHGALSSPVLTDKPLEPSTRAYNMLSSFVHRAPSSGTSTPSSSLLTSPLTSPRSSFMSRRSSNSTTTSNGIERSGRSKSTSSRKPSDRSPRLEITTIPRSRSQTPRPPHSPHRCMTPPIEESSSSSDGCPAKQTISALRKILDEQPPPKQPEPRRQPAFFPLSPPPIAEAETSTATASVSRLFTKPTHTSSTRPPSPPRHSALKSSASTSPTPRTSPSPTMLSIPDMLGAGVVLLGGSLPGSGRSTPKRISFAQLPESYASSRPEGSSSKFQQKKNRKKGRRDSAGKDGKGSGSDDNLGSWWLQWLVGAGAPGPSAVGRLRQEDRGWSGRSGFTSPTGFDEWAV